MKSAFSLFELIIVILILSILVSFIALNVSSSLDSSIKVKIKSEIALIRNSISKYKTKNILLGKGTLIVLDDAQIDTNKTMLFNNILEFPLISTSRQYKVVGNWIKKTSIEYIIYIKKDAILEFKLEDNSFNCKSSISLCKEFE